MGRYTVIPTDAFDALQVDAGVILTNFNPLNPFQNPESKDILAATTGGIKPVCTPNYEDYGADVDNVPDNMLEFKNLTSWTASIAFSSIKFNAENTLWSLGAADSELLHNGVTKIVPRRSVKTTDFKDIWWVGDKANGGAYAIRLMNALSTGGLNIQSTKNGKGTNAVTVTGHVSIYEQDKMPMEIYDIPPQEIFTPVTVEADPADTTYPWTSYTPSDFQSNIKVEEGAITGTLHYVTDFSPSGPLAGDGYYLALKFSDIDEDATSVKVGLDPSQGTGLVEIIDDPDKDCVVKVHNKDEQIFKVVTSNINGSSTQVFSLSGLTLDGGV